MARTTVLTCEHCEDTIVERDEDQTALEQGWISVMKFDTMEDDVKAYDFCSNECLSYFFS